MIIQLITLILTAYSPAPVVSPNGVPFDPNTTYDVVYAEQVELNEYVQLEIKVVDEANDLSATCSQGVLNSPWVKDVNGMFEYTYLWDYTPDYGMHYIDFFFLDSGSLAKGVTAVLYVPSPITNNPPVVTSVERYIEPNELVWVSPDSVNDVNNTWQNESALIDSNESTYAQSTAMNVPVELNLDIPCVSDRCRVNARFGGRSWKIEIYDSVWTEVYSGQLEDGWNEITYTPVIISKWRISQIGGSINGSIREFEVGR